MTDLTVGCFRYDTTAPLVDGTIGVPGYDTHVDSAGIASDVFERMVRDHAYDASELGLTFYLRTLEQPDPPFVAVPAFTVRMFRHSAVYVHADSGIERPEDLVDRTIGEFGIYGQDPGVWMKGILSDGFGFRPERNRWLIGGLDEPMSPFGFVPLTHPPEVDVRAEPDRALADMLETGEIDALFSANVPRCVLQGSPRVRRLFPDYSAVERDWYRRNGLFPMMHTVVVRRDVLARDPGLAKAVYDAFTRARDITQGRYLGPGRRVYQATTMIPWMNALVEDDLALFGEDWWPYGVDANRAELETFLRYHHEQGLTRRFDVDELFAPELLGT